MLIFFPLIVHLLFLISVFFLPIFFGITLFLIPSSSIGLPILCHIFTSYPYLIYDMAGVVLFLKVFEGILAECQNEKSLALRVKRRINYISRVHYNARGNRV
jgi:hypothetical protein